MASELFRRLGGYRSRGGGYETGSGGFPAKPFDAENVRALVSSLLDQTTQERYRGREYDNYIELALVTISCHIIGLSRPIVHETITSWGAGQKEFAAAATGPRAAPGALPGWRPEAPPGWRCEVRVRTVPRGKPPGNPFGTAAPRGIARLGQGGPFKISFRRSLFLRGRVHGQRGI